VYGLVHAPVNSPIEGVDYLQLDLSNYWNYDQLPGSLDVVMHLAQSANYKDFPINALDVFRVNLESTARLLDYAHHIGIKKFIYASSGGVYGNGMNAFHENAPIVSPGKLGYYLGSKASSEILVHSYASVFQVIILRPFFMYGAGQKPGMLIPRLMNAVASDLPITLQGKTGIRINPVHVADAAKAVCACLHIAESATFNIAGPQVLSIRDICELLGDYLGKDVHFTTLDGEPQDLVADINAMQSLLHTPQIQLREKLSEVYACLKN
jgi:UDP-glucose 4-epimerase